MVAPVVSVVNMKGGVGKTTISANVFRAFYQRHRKKTLLIDFDPQYNLSQLVLTRRQYDSVRDAKRTLWHVINPEESPSIFHTSERDLMQPGPLESFTHRLRYMTRPSTVTLDLLPGDFRTSSINLMTDSSALRIRRQRFFAMIDEARTLYDLVVLDCNPSSSFMTRAAIEVATHLLIPVRADRYSILGLEMLMQYAGELPDIGTQPEPLIVLNGLSRSSDQQDVINQLRSDPVYGPCTLAAEVRHSKVLDAKADYTGFAQDKPTSYRFTVAGWLSAVADEISTRLRITA